MVESIARTEEEFVSGILSCSEINTLKEYMRMNFEFLDSDLKYSQFYDFLKKTGQEVSRTQLKACLKLFMGSSNAVFLGDHTVWLTPVGNRWHRITVTTSKPPRERTSTFFEISFIRPKKDSQEDNSHTGAWKNKDGQMVKSFRYQYASWELSNQLKEDHHLLKCGFDL